MIEPIINMLRTWNELKVGKQLLDTFAKYAGSYTEYDTLAMCYNIIKQYASAIEYAQKALVVADNNEQLYATRSNLAKLYNQINHPQLALDYLQINERITPNDDEIVLEKAFSLFLLNRKPEGAALLHQVLNTPGVPDNVKDRVLFNLGTHEMHTGEYKQGLAKFVNCGTTLDLWQNLVLPLTKWDGIIRIGKPIVIYAKGGIGDELINVRFYFKLKNMGMDPIWYTDRKEINTIFTRHGVKCISSIQDIPNTTLWTHSMALPVTLDLDEHELNYGAYLTVDPTHDTKWKQIVCGNKVKVGLRWAGNMEYDQDLHRSIPILDVYEAIRNNEKCDYYSLQRDDGADQACLLDDVVDLQEQLVTYEDALAAINQLDVFITSCTSLAHAASAMGKRVIVLVPITAYYVWIGEHWYGNNVTVLFQSAPRVWDQEIQQLQQLLTTEGYM